MSIQFYSGSLLKYEFNLLLSSSGYTVHLHPDQLVCVLSAGGRDYTANIVSRPFAGEILNFCNDTGIDKVSGAFICIVSCQSVQIENPILLFCFLPSSQYMRDSRGAKCSLSFSANAQDGALGETSVHPYPP